MGSFTYEGHIELYKVERSCRRDVLCRFVTIRDILDTVTLAQWHLTKRHFIYKISIIDVFSVGWIEVLFVKNCCHYHFRALCIFLPVEKKYECPSDWNGPTPNPVSDSCSHTERIKLLTHHRPGLVINDKVFYLEAASLPDTSPSECAGCKPRPRATRPALSSSVMTHFSHFSLHISFAVLWMTGCRCCSTKPPLSKLSPLSGR